MKQNLSFHSHLTGTYDLNDYIEHIFMSIYATILICTGVLVH